MFPSNLILQSFQSETFMDVQPFYLGAQGIPFCLGGGITKRRIQFHASKPDTRGDWDMQEQKRVRMSERGWSEESAHIECRSRVLIYLGGIGQAQIGAPSRRAPTWSGAATYSCAVVPRRAARADWVASQSKSPCMKAGGSEVPSRLAR